MCLKSNLGKYLDEWIDLKFSILAYFDLSKENLKTIRRRLILVVSKSWSRLEISNERFSELKISVFFVQFFLLAVVDVIKLFLEKI